MFLRQPRVDKPNTDSGKVSFAGFTATIVFPSCSKGEVKARGIHLVEICNLPARSHWTFEWKLNHEVHESKNVILCVDPYAPPVHHTNTVYQCPLAEEGRLLRL